MIKPSVAPTVLRAKRWCSFSRPSVSSPCQASSLTLSGHLIAFHVERIPVEQPHLLASGRLRVRWNSFLFSFYEYRIIDLLEGGTAGK